MTFYDRYVALCGEHGIDPCSQSTADALGVSKATISLWGKNANVPKGDTLSKICDLLGVSADYLLLRTDERNYVMPSDIDKDSMRILRLIMRLDDRDKGKVEGLIEGMLMAEKYDEV